MEQATRLNQTDLVLFLAVDQFCNMGKVSYYLKLKEEVRGCISLSKDSFP